MSAHDVPDLAYGDAPDSFDADDGRTYSEPAAATPGPAGLTVEAVPRRSTAWDGEGEKLGVWLAELDAAAPDELLRRAKLHATAHHTVRAGRESTLRSWQQAVGDGLNALNRVRRLVDVHAKTLKMDDLLTALAETCDVCGARRGSQQMRMLRPYGVACPGCCEHIEAQS